MSVSITYRAAEFAAAAQHFGVLNEDGETMTEADAYSAIVAVCENEADEDGGFSCATIDHDGGWSWIEALVLDRFGYAPEALQGVVTV